MSTRGVKILCGVVAALALAACGGGGGGGGGSSTHADGVASSGSSRAASTYSGLTGAGAITNETQGNSAAGASVSINDVSDANTNVVFRGTASATSTPSTFDALQWVVSIMQAQGGTSALMRSGNVAAKSGSAACPGPGTGGGSISGDASISNPVAGGDYAVLTFSNCSIGGKTLNGTAAFDIRSASGYFPYSYTSVNMYFAADDLTITDDFDGTWVNVSGAYNLTASDPYGTGDVDGHISGTTLAIESSDHLFGTTKHRKLLLQDFSQHIVKNGSSVATEFSGTVTSFVLGASFSVTTVQTIQRLTPSSYPSSGILVATGQNGRKVRVTALNPTQVQLEYDLDGDGTYDTLTIGGVTANKFTLNWADLPLPLV